MHPNAERVQAALAAAGVPAEVVEFAESTRTAAEAAAAIGTSIAQIAKSLVFLAGDEPVLVIASGANRVSTAKLAALVGAPVRRADADAVRRASGYPVGGVPPLAHATPLRVLLDRDLLTFDAIWAAAGTPNAVFRIAPDELVRITGGALADVREE
jgi:prolyl-tRNA editing enzyme YbaK/EbsC (Cys-tRNA(Pro) deacylase)